MRQPPKKRVVVKKKSPQTEVGTGPQNSNGAPSDKNGIKSEKVIPQDKTPTTLSVPSHKKHPKSPEKNPDKTAPKSPGEQPVNEKTPSKEIKEEKIEPENNKQTEKATPKNNKAEAKREGITKTPIKKETHTTTGGGTNNSPAPKPQPKKPATLTPKKTPKQTEKQVDVYRLTPELSAVCGVTEASEFTVIKALFKYISGNKLRCNSKDVKCDEKLKAIFNTDTIQLLTMPNAIKPLLIKTGKTIASNSTSSDNNKRKAIASPSKSTPPHKKPKTTKQKNPKVLSPGLAEFVGKTTAMRSEVLTKLSAYIKEKNLADPQDSKHYLFDETLQKIFKVKDADIPKLRELLREHLKDQQGVKN